MYQSKTFCCGIHQLLAESARYASGASDSCSSDVSDDLAVHSGVSEYSNDSFRLHAVYFCCFFSSSRSQKVREASCAIFRMFLTTFHFSQGIDESHHVCQVKLHFASSGSRSYVKSNLLTASRRHTMDVSHSPSSVRSVPSCKIYQLSL